jgi:hypothetical protein
MATRTKKTPRKDPSYKDMKADYYPVQRTIQLGSTSNAAQHKIVDVGRLLSNVNHRLYRQGKTYQVKLDLDTELGNGKYTVWALVDTWYIQKAWQLARATYEKSMADERAQVGAKMAARWEDFRVNAGISSITPEDAVPYRYDTALTGARDTDGEFLPSRITLSDGTTQRTFTWGPTAGASLGMLEEYDKVDNTQTNIATTALAYAGVDDETQEAAADDLKTRGDLPPYKQYEFSSSVWVKIATLESTNSGSPPGSVRLSTGFFNAPCGLIVVETPTPNTALLGQLSLTVKAGDYKGVAGMNIGV